MRFNLSKPNLGEFRHTRPFAWFPRRLGPYLVWLERYEKFEKYEVVRKSKLKENCVIWFEVTEWVLLGEGATCETT